MFALYGIFDLKCLKKSRFEETTFALKRSTDSIVSKDNSIKLATLDVSMELTARAFEIEDFDQEKAVLSNDWDFLSL